MRNKPSSLKIIAWSANSLNDKKLDLEEYLARENIDIALICETHLHGSLTPKIKNYAFYNTNRTHGRGGGTAIYVKGHIEHHQIINPVLREIESTLQ